MKKSLMILVVGALVGTMLIGCGSGTEGNNGPDGATPVTKSGTDAAGTDANAPAPGADANAPAPDANAAAK